MIFFGPYTISYFQKYWASLVAQMVKKSVFSAGDLGSIPGSRRSPGEGNGYSLPYFCLENFMDRGAWQATVHGVAKSWTQLNPLFESMAQVHF